MLKVEPARAFSFFARYTIPLMTESNKEVEMILLIILILIVFILTTVVVLSVSAIGSAAILIFGDVIVCIGFLVWLIKKLVTKD